MMDGKGLDKRGEMVIICIMLEECNQFDFGDCARCD